MSIILQNVCVLDSLDEGDFKFAELSFTEGGFFSFTINVKPIKPFNMVDLYQEYEKLRQKLFYETKKFNLCGHDFSIGMISIPSHYQYLSVWLQGSEPIYYWEARDIAVKLLSLAETSRNPYNPVIHCYTLEDPRPWYKRIFDWFL